MPVRHNEISKAIGGKGAYHGESVRCPYCESEVAYPDSRTECPACNQMFRMEGFTAMGYDNPEKRIPAKAVSGALLREAVSDMVMGRKGWKYVVCTYRNPDSAKEYNVYWAMEGAPELFRNTDRVDFQEAGKRAMIDDETNQTDFSYNPDMEGVGGIKDIKKLIPKYGLEPDGYSVSSFLISPDGTKAYTGMDIRDTSEPGAKPFFIAISRCTQLQKELQQKYKPEDYPSGSALQMAINNFIRDNPLILCWTSDNVKPRQAGYFNELWKTQPQTEGMRKLARMGDISILLVDGRHIREKYDIDFEGGGNGMRYSWIPKLNIWLESGKSHDQILHNVEYEITELLTLSEKDMSREEIARYAEEAKKRVSEALVML